MERPHSPLGKLLAWRIRHVSNRQFILVLSVVVGLAGGLAAALLKSMIYYLEILLTHGFHEGYENFLYFFYPLAGIVLSVLLVRLFYQHRFAPGLTNVLHSIARLNSIVRIKDTLLFSAGSVLTVGMGGSAGMEATVVMGGSGAGSNIARLLHLPYRSRVLLLGCGAAAALAAFFGAPVAGVIFAFEVLILDLTMAALVPLLMASVAGAITGRLLMGEALRFDYTMYDPFMIGDVPFYILLGIAAGLIAVLFYRIERTVSAQLKRITQPLYRALIGGSILGLLIFLFPPLYGEGYEIIDILLKGEAELLLHNSYFYPFKDNMHWILIFLALVLLLKLIAVPVTLGSGGMGGYFAPSLIIGGITGFLFARLLNLSGLTEPVSESNFILVGMAGVLSGVFHSPLSAIFLIAELTEGYELIVPLMLTSALAYVVIIYFEKHSIFSRQLAERGELVTRHKDKVVLTLLQLRKLIEKDFRYVHPDWTLGQMLEKAVSHSSRNIFPVVNEEGKLQGVVLLDDIRKSMFRPELYDKVYVYELMHLPPASIREDEPMPQVARKFDETQAWNLPVVDHADKYVGFISKSRLLAAYRKVLMDVSEE